MIRTAYEWSIGCAQSSKCASNEFDMYTLKNLRAACGILAALTSVTALAQE